MKKLAAKAAFLALVAVFGFVFVTRQALAATTVSPSNMGIWQGNGGSVSAQFVLGSAPLGSGSVRLFTGSDGSQTASVGANFPNSDFSGTTSLLDVTKLEYSALATTQSGASINQPFVYIGVLTDGGSDTLIFDPNAQSTGALLNSWQTWNVKNGAWNSNLDPNPGHTLTQYISFITVAYGPTITVTNIKFQVGPASSSDIFDGNVDNFTIGISGADTTYDFEPDAAPPATNSLSQQFYTDNNFTNPMGSPTILASNSFKYNWGMGSPMPGVPVDNFSARWEGTFDFESAPYRFTAASDNKVKIYVDGVVVLDAQTKAPAQGIVQMTAGVHTVKVEYIHATGAAKVSVNFWKRTVCYDMSADNVITSADLGIVASHYSSVPVLNPWDINGDNIVNSADLGLVASKFGRTCPF